jgi:hypothetical protein
MIGKLHEALCKTLEAFDHYMKIIKLKDEPQSINVQIITGTAKRKLKEREKKVKAESLNFDFYMVFEDEEGT